MATAIFHLNVSSSARDFAAVALEPGVPLIDRSGAHFSLLARWFGPDVAEPVWRSLDQIEFFVRDQQQARLAEVLTRLATPQELSTAGKRFVEGLASRCQKIKTTTETEQHLLATIKEQLAELQESVAAGEGENALMKYREPGGRWQWVWCWGVQRRDHDPARAALCSNRDCRLLYLIRAGAKKPACPACGTGTSLRRPRFSLTQRVPVLFVLLLSLVIAAAGWALFNPPRLITEPRLWHGPAGSTVPFKLIARRWYFFDRDVTAETLARSGDPAVIQFTSDRCVATARTPGKAIVTFQYQDFVATADVDVSRSLAQAPATSDAERSKQAATPLADSNGTKKLADANHSGNAESDHATTADNSKAHGTKNAPSTTATAKSNAEKSPSKQAIPASIDALAKQLADAFAGKNALNAASHGDKTGAGASGANPAGHSTAGANAAPNPATSPANTAAKPGVGSGLAKSDTNHAPAAGATAGSGVASVVPPSAMVGSAAHPSAIHPSSTYAPTVGASLPHAAVVHPMSTGHSIGTAHSVGTGHVVGAGPLASVPHGYVPLSHPVPLGGYAGPYPWAVSGGPVFAGRNYAPHGLAYRGGNVVVDHWPVGSAWVQHGLPNGTVITGVNGTVFNGLPGGYPAYFNTNPLVAGDVVHYRGPDGTVGDVRLLGNVPAAPPVQAAVYDVKLAGIRVLALAGNTLQAQFEFELAETADYRLVDQNQQPLSDWVRCNARSVATIAGNAIARTADDNYELFLERRNSEGSKMFQVAFQLTHDQLN